jgi:hypothetical protein
LASAFTSAKWRFGGWLDTYLLDLLLGPYTAWFRRICMDSRVAELEDALEDLKEEVRYLRGEVRRLRRLVDDRDSRSDGSQRSSRAYSEGSFSLVEREFNENASRSRSDTPCTEPASAAGSDPGRTGSTRTPQSWLEREGICDEIAEFIKRSLDGDHRGASGRDRLRLPSRIWLVFRDYEGLHYKPVRVCRSWQSCKDLVKRGDGAGESIFVGLPSEREACRVAERSGVGWPTSR